MSTYVLMRILESSPDRYDRGMHLLTLGRLDRAYDRLARRVEPGQRVLDLGCGTGALALRIARRGARVKAIDVNAGMLEIAARRAREAGLSESIELAEMGVAELDGEPAESYDAVTSGLCFSELSPDELRYALAAVVRLLRSGGLLLVADEVAARGPGGRLLQSLLRAPLAALAWVVTQQTTHPVEQLPEALGKAGLSILSFERNALGGLAEIVAQKPGGDAA